MYFKYLAFLLPLIISYTLSANTFSEDDFCASENAAVTTLLAQIFQCINANQNLTQHLLLVNERLHHLQTGLEDNRRQLDQHMQQHQSIISTAKDDDHIVIQRRQDGSVDFYRTWNEYKHGFGDSSREFFIGLDQLHKLTNSRPYALLIVMEDWENERRFAKYDDFVVGSEKEKYELKVLGTYSGTAGDSLSAHLGQKFSTKDQENDRNEKEHCAVWYTGAWWYNACHVSNLNGRYIRGGPVGVKEIAQGIHWNSFRSQDYSLKFVEMSLYAKKF